MNRTELAAAIAEKTGMNKVASKEAMNACLDIIREELNKGEKVSLIGFGTFSPVDRPARTAKNPRTGEKMEVPAKTMAKFKAAAGFIATDDNTSKKK